MRREGRREGEREGGRDEERERMKSINHEAESQGSRKSSKLWRRWTLVNDGST